MREENYFKIKLESTIETLQMAKSKLEHLDIQMNLLEVRFEHDKKVYNDQVIHMQKIVSNMEKRIPELEKKISLGYTTIDMRTGKAFKSFNERHVGLLKDKLKATEEQRKIAAEKYKERQALKRKKRSKMTKAELDVIVAEEVRVEAQPKDELKANRERERERLEAKAEKYRLELEELKAKAKEKPAKVVEELLDELKPPEEPIIEVPISPEDLSEDEKAILEEVSDIVEEKLSKLHEGKVQCPECKEWFTKGGAFARHYQSHVNGD